MNLLAATVAGAIGYLLLRVVYRALQFNWPLAYRDMTDAPPPWRERSVVGFTVYAVLPGLVIGTCLVVNLARIEVRPAWLSLAVISLAEAIRVSAAIINANAGYRVKVAIFSLSRLAATFAALWFTLFVGPFAQAFVPTLPEFSTAALTGALAAFVGLALVQALVRNPSSDTGPVDDLSGDLIDSIRVVAQKYGVPPQVPVAIAAFENRQRPSWVRAAERFLVRITRGRLELSQGIMQERSRRPLGDIESIEASISRNAAAWGAVNVDDYQDLRRVADSHHPDHADRVINLFWAAQRRIDST